MQEKVGSTVPKSELGFCTQPRKFGNSQVLKSYRGKLTKKKAEEMVAVHRRFIDNLRQIGINVPETEMRIVPSDKKYTLQVVQERFEKDELAGEIIKSKSREEVVSLVKGVMRDSLKFLNSPFSRTMGFHATIRNYALRDGKLFMLDTFPPYGSKKETKKMMKQHAPTRLMRLVSTFGSPFLGAYIKEYYDAPTMLSGIVGTSCRLRPELEHDIKEAATSLVESQNFQWKEKFLREISKSPKQKLRWKLGRLIKRK